MGRRRFDHLAVELSLALDRAVPRFALWHAVHEAGGDPERLSREAALAFCDGPLQGFVTSLGFARLRPPALRRLRRRVARFDPRYPGPEELFARL